MSGSHWYGLYIEAAKEVEKAQALLRQLREERDKAVAEWRLARAQAEDLAQKLRQARGGEP